MSLTEAKHVWPPLKDNSPASVHWNRIENAVGTGMSDLEGCHCGVSVWVENKVYKGNKLVFQPTQPGWIIRRRLAGGRVFVLARKKDVFYLYDGARVNDLVARGIDVPWDFATERPWDWPGLLAAIFGHRVL